MKKSLTFTIPGGPAQIDFIDQLKRKLKVNFHIKADQKRLTVTLRGDPENIRKAVSQAQGIFRDTK